MKIFGRAWIGVVILTLRVVALEQDSRTLSSPLPSTGSLQFYADICQFEGNSGKTLVELSYSVNLDQLLADLPADMNEITLLIQITLVPQPPDSAVRFSEPKVISIPADRRPGTLVDMKRLHLKPGTVNFELVITEFSTGVGGTITRRFDICSFSPSCSISDIAFIRHLHKSSQQGTFEKNGLFMVPNPSRTYFKNSAEPDFYIYYELNHLSYNPEQTCFYNVHCEVTDLTGRTIWSRIREGIPTKSTGSARVEKIPLQNFSSGLFKLNLMLVDVTADRVAKSSSYFSVYADEYEARMVLPMSEEDIRRYTDQIRYITTAEERKTFQQLDTYGKQQFLITFWKSKDTNPSTPQNEFMQQYFKNLAYCDKTFRGGIKSDMARIYLTYGSPLEVNRQPSFRGTNQSAETWIYPINGRTEFVFVDRLGDGTYVLAHSTHPEEYQNEKWYEEVMGTVESNNR